MCPIKFLLIHLHWCKPSKRCRMCIPYWNTAAHLPVRLCNAFLQCFKGYSYCLVCNKECRFARFFSPLITQMLTLTFVVPLTFGILIAWIALSCITIPLFQWFVRRHNWTSSLNAAASVPPSRGLDHGKPAREAENDTRDSEKAEWLARSGCLVCVHP